MCKDMYKVLKRMAVCLSVMLLWAGTAGFMRLDSQVSIGEDGAVSLESKMMVLKKFKKNLDALQAKLKKQNTNIVFEPVREGEYRGYVMRTGAATYFSSIDGFIASYNGTAHSSKSEGLFSETYTIYVIFPHNEQLRKEMLKDPLVRKYPPQYKLRIDLPCAADSHNADKSMNDGKSLSWDLSPAMLGKMREVKVVFTLWNKQLITIIACIGVALVLVLFSLLIAVLRSGGSPAAEPAPVLDQSFIDSQFKTMTGRERYGSGGPNTRY
ncbi:MAG: hypothetical protein Q4F00_06730 [bacterium]|nr:hypothetical protein [bacterium]